MTPLLESIKYLVDNDYLIQNRGRYIFTAKFYCDTIGEDLGIVIVDKPVIKSKESPDKVDWVYKFQQFIINSGVPQTAFDNKGVAYRINTATKPGREAFKKAIQSGQKEEDLMQAVQIYYKESRQFRVKIEKFFVDEMWRSIDPTDPGSNQSNVITRIRFA